MTKMTLSAVILATVQVAAAQVTASKKPGGENSDFSVSLKLSDEEFDPSKPKGTIAC
jgi:hypothetical protein